MDKKKVNKAAIIKSITKMIANKEAVRSYIKGNTDIKTMAEKGIKFAKPI